MKQGSVKLSLDGLALFGGDPVFSRPRLVGRPNLGDRARFLERLGTVLDSGWLTNDGPFVREFEDRLAEVAGVRHCVATTNGTQALQVLFQALDLTGEVLMPSMTYVATPHSARMAGLRPVFCDVDPATGCIDPRAVAASVTSRTSAVLGVHVWGQPCAVDELERVSEEHGLRLIFDAAEALGCSYHGRPIGSLGDAEVFSFHATKVVNSFEGGAVATDDEGLADLVRSLRNFGWGPDGRTERLGTNAKLTEAAAAMGLTSLEALPETSRHNRANLARYRTELHGLDGVSVLDLADEQQQACQYSIVMVDEAVTGIHRDLLMRVLMAENVVVRPYFSPACHQLEPYRSETPVVLPHTERVARQVLALPTGPAVSPADVSRIVELIRYVVAAGPQVTARFRHRGEQVPA